MKTVYSLQCKWLWIYLNTGTPSFMERMSGMMHDWVSNDWSVTSRLSISLSLYILCLQLLWRYEDLGGPLKSADIL